MSSSGRIPPPADDDEPFAPKNTYLFSGGFFAPSRIESPMGLIIGGIVVLIAGPIFGAVLYAASPQPRPTVAALIAGGMAVALVAIGAFALYAGVRRRAWRLARGIPVNARIDRPGPTG